MRLNILAIAIIGILIYIVSYPLFAAPSLEREATLSFDVPTTRTDGDVLAITDIDHFDLYCGEQSGTYTDQLPQITHDGVSTQYAVPFTIPMSLRYCASTCTDTDGLESAYSNEVKLRMPPQTLIITLD